jgi:hypothetical protein
MVKGTTGRAQTGIPEDRIRRTRVVAHQLRARTLDDTIKHVPNSDSQSHCHASACLYFFMYVIYVCVMTSNHVFCYLDGTPWQDIVWGIWLDSETL